MSDYLLIESRDPAIGGETALFHDVARDLVAAGHGVTLFLVENGVFGARSSPASRGIAALAGVGVQVLADDFSLRERGIGEDRMLPEVRPAALDIVIDQLAAGRKALWH